jgi:hypothetical protein
MSGSWLIRVLVEVAIAGAVCGVMGRVADADNRQPLFWAAISIVVCVASLAIPVPIVRLMLAGGAVLAAMFVTNLVRLPSL